MKYYIVEILTKIAGVLMIVAAILILWLVAYEATQLSVREKNIPCYDRYGNEIVGQVCIENKINIERNIMMLTVLGIACSLMGIHLLCEEINNGI